MQRQELADAVARLRRDLRRLQRGGERGDHVELAPARDLRAAREVDRLQLDRRPRQRAHDGAARRPGRSAAAATRAGRAPRCAGRRPRRRRAGGAPRAPPARPRPPGPRARSSARARAIRSRRDALAADQPLDVGGDALRLRALVRRAPERDLAGRPRRGRRAASRCGPPAARRPRRRRRGSARGQRKLRSSGTTVASGSSAWKSRRFFVAARAEAVDRLVVVAGRGEVAVLGGEQPQQQPVREVRLLHVVDEHVAVARGDLRAHVRVLAQQRAARGSRGRRRRARPASASMRSCAR